MPSRTILNVILRNPSHIHVRVFSGDTTLAKNGDLVFTTEEWEHFSQVLELGIAEYELRGWPYNININDDTSSDLNDIT